MFKFYKSLFSVKYGFFYIKKIACISLILSSLVVSTAGYSYSGKVMYSDEVQYIGKDVFYIEDPGHSFSVDEIWLKRKTGQLTQCSRHVFAKPSTLSSYWFVFDLKNNTEKDVWLDIHNSNLDSLKFYKLNRKGEVLKSVITGSYFPRSTRIYDVGTFWFNLLDKSDTSSYTIMVKAFSGAMMEVPMKIGSFQSLWDSRSRTAYLSFFFIGGLTLMSLYNLFNFGFTGNRVYLYYALYIFFIMLNATQLNNFPVAEYLFGHKIVHHYALLWLSPAFIMLGLFSVSYLRLKEISLIMFRFIYVEIFLLIIVSILNLFIPLGYLSSFYQVFVGFLIATCLYSGYLSFKKNNYGTMLYLVGWTVMLASGLVYLGVVNGVVPFNMFFRHFLYYGVLAEIIIFSIGLAGRMNNLKLRQKAISNELIKKNEELTSINKSLDLFNYHVSHDLKTVFVNGESLSRMLVKYSNSKMTDKLERIIDKLRNTSESGMITVSSFLSMSSPETVLTETEPEQIDIKAIINSLLNKHGLTSKIKVELVHDDIKTISATSYIIESILLNFLTNTIKYNTNFPRAKISFFSEGNTIKMIYVDNGIGIDLKKDGEKLFQPYKRIYNKLRTEGTGLGLYLVKKMVVDSGGRIDVKSEVGEGTCFIVSLPFNNNGVIEMNKGRL